MQRYIVSPQLRGLWIALFVWTAAFSALVTSANAGSGSVVALGASQTAGKGLSPNQAFPAQLETMLHAKGFNVRVVNAGISGDTTGGMLSRLDQVTRASTKVVVLQPGGNDERKGSGSERSSNISEIERRLHARGIKVIMLENGIFRGLPKQPDGQHLTPEGYHAVAAHLLPQVISALRR
jgi:acyl-CoA thioesterase-1